MCFKKHPRDDYDTGSLTLTLSEFEITKIFVIIASQRTSF